MPQQALQKTLTTRPTVRCVQSLWYWQPVCRSARSLDITPNSNKPSDDACCKILVHSVPDSPGYVATPLQLQTWSSFSRVRPSSQNSFSLHQMNGARFTRQLCTNTATARLQADHARVMAAQPLQMQLVLPISALTCEQVASPMVSITLCAKSYVPQRMYLPGTCVLSLASMTCPWLA